MASQSQKPLWLFGLFFMSILRLASSQYLVIPNSAKTYGPDGPWNAFSLSVGSNNQPMDMYMGGPFSSVIISNAICSSTEQGSCPARDFGGGVYNYTASTTSNTRLIGLTSSGSINFGYGAGSLLDLTGASAVMMDRMVIGGGSLLQQTIQNVSINRIDRATHTLPGGAKYDLEVGFLSIGAPDLIQSFGFGDSRPAINTTIPVNQLAIDGVTGSRSWGMHIGSAQLGQPGSLVFGGYDRSRVSSDPATFDIKNGGDLEVILQSIKFGVMEGESPWDSTPGGNMLVLNTTMADPQIPVRLSAVAPYLYLPRNTCNEIAQHLPLTLAPSLDLYLWNTSDPIFSTIVNSTAYIQFGFSYRGGEYPVKIPIKLLALDLEQPFPVLQKTSYFPCRPTESNDDTGYYLGRSFLQGAFLGLSWSPNKFWLAQAPGPLMRTSDIYSINPTDTTIAALADVDWAASWTDVLTVKKSASGSDSGGPTPQVESPVPGDSNPTSSGGSGGLSGGAIAGAVIGGLVVLLIAAAVFFFVTKRKKKQAAVELPITEITKQPIQPGETGISYYEADNYAYTPASELPPVEMDAGGYRDQPHRS